MYYLKIIKANERQRSPTRLGPAEAARLPRTQHPSFLCALTGGDGPGTHRSPCTSHYSSDENGDN